MKLGYKSLAFDICTTYLWADVRPNEEIPIRYPTELRKKDSETGEELYAILKKNCYGMPQADRRYSQLRDTFILKEFNSHGWSCSKSKSDPCLFIFKSPTSKQTLFVIHTDDCDGVGESLDDLKYIADKFDKRFKIKYCNSRFMLGIQRDITKTREHTILDLTQPDFIDTTTKQFEKHFPKREVNTPFPASTLLHKLLDEPNDEVSHELIVRGYQRLGGSLLWAARNCHPDISFGVNNICRLMGKPTERAWKCAIHILKYISKSKTRGIRFKSNGNPMPICYYDASNKGDPSDGKSQWGFVIFLFDGPVSWGSKKHNHVGLSSTHNEYMALCQASKEVVWLRKLLKEVGYMKENEPPTPMIGDNANATIYSREDLITPGNKFIIQDYHFARECMQRGEICTRQVDTSMNFSDVFTKGVSRQTIERLGPILFGHGGGLPTPPDPPLD